MELNSPRETRKEKTARVDGDPHERIRVKQIFVANIKRLVIISQNLLFRISISQQKK